MEEVEEACGLYYYRLRYYDPEAGRFVSRDPLGMWGDPGQRGNAQNYCGNNPVNGVDPLGNWGWVIPLVEGIFGGALLGGSGYVVADAYAQHETTAGFAAGSYEPGLALESFGTGAKEGAVFGAGAGAVGVVAKLPRVAALVATWGRAGTGLTLFGSGVGGQAASDLYHGEASSPGTYALSGGLFLAFGGLRAAGNTQPTLGQNVGPTNMWAFLWGRSRTPEYSERGPSYEIPAEEGAVIPPGPPPAAYYIRTVVEGRSATVTYNGRPFAVGEVGADGMLELVLHVESAGLPRNAGYGGFAVRSIAGALERAGVEIRGVRGIWSRGDTLGDNMEAFNRASGGRGPSSWADAASQTPTGSIAASLRFPRVGFMELVGQDSSGNFNAATVHFYPAIDGGCR